jgi:hypothetical protein
MYKHILMFFCAMFLCISQGCDNAPINKLIDPTVSNKTGTWPAEWVLYDDEIKTGGTVQMYTTMEGQELLFNSTDHPYQGTQCVKYSWDGSAVTEYLTNTRENGFVGFGLIAADSVNRYSEVSKDLTLAGYTKISFRVRGSLNTNVYLRIEAQNGNYLTPSGTNAWQSNTINRRITGDWQQYEFSLSGSQATIRDFVRVILVYDEDGNPNTPNTRQGNGGTVYLDDIRLTK